MDLYNNPLTSLPESIGDLSSLLWLNISSTQIILIENLPDDILQFLCDFIISDHFYDCYGNCINDIDNNGICDDIGTVNLKIQNVNLEAKTLEVHLESDKIFDSFQYKISGIEAENNIGYLSNMSSTFIKSTDTIITHNYANYLGGNICIDTNGIDLPPFDDGGKGDLNEDGVVNILDLRILHRCVLQTNCEISSNSDINGDGSIMVNDILALGFYLLSINDRTITVGNIYGNPMNTTVGGCYCVNDIDEDEICDELEIVGCQDDSACNYDETATDSGDCTYPDTHYNCDGNCINDTDGDSVCDELEVVGCQDDSACNYNALATDAGECAIPTACDTCAEGEVVTDGALDGICESCNDGAITDNDTDDDGVCDADDLSLYKGLIPEKFNISSIYPNPFNPVTKITYGLPENTDIQITVFDMGGTHITTLLNTFQIEGYHTISWNASSYPSGVYLIRMDSGDFTQTQKVVLVK